MRLVKILIPGILILLLIKNILYSGIDVLFLIKNLNPIPVLLALPILILIYPEAGLAYQMILKKLGIKLNTIKAIKLWVISNTGRYIPGVVWQYVGRVELFKRNSRSERTEIIQSLFLEMLLIIISALLVSALSLPILSNKYPLANKLIFLTPLLIIFFHPGVSNTLMKLINKITRKTSLEIKLNLSFSDLISILPFFILNFLMNGLVIYLIVNSFEPLLNPRLVLSISGIYAFSWLLGYIAVFSPGGLGVTEISLAYLLSFVIPLSLASFVAILYRFLLICTEFLVFIVALNLKD